MSCSVSSLVILLILGMVLPPAGNNMAGNGTRIDENMGHAHPLIHTVRHRSLHGQIKINVFVAESVAVSVSVHMESCTIHF